ncbi:MAG: hypothetical protein ACTHZW_10575, partial [Microbacteriaceae bacterium]
MLPAGDEADQLHDAHSRWNHVGVQRVCDLCRREWRSQSHEHHPQFPLFVLSFCIFPVRDYVSTVVPQLQTMKFEFFGHDMVVLHEREIRKATPPFDILLNHEVRDR